MVFSQGVFMNTDCRWLQRFNNYKNALGRLRAAVLLSQERALSELEEQGLVKAFEFTHELAWNVMKDYLVFQGHTLITGSRDAIRLAFQVGLITDGENWMDTIIGRNKSSHTYDAAIAQSLASKITSCYYDLFCQFEERMSTLAPS
jgi:nucleotidyltransferase substrate binding protein (TIGR01987 family)